MDLACGGGDLWAAGFSQGRSSTQLRITHQACDLKGSSAGVGPGVIEEQGQHTRATGLAGVRGGCAQDSGTQTAVCFLAGRAERWDAWK